MSVLEAKEFLEVRGCQVTLIHQNSWEIIRPGATSPMVRDAAGLVLMVEAVRKAGSGQWP